MHQGEWHYDPGSEGVIGCKDRNKIYNKEQMKPDEKHPYGKNISALSLDFLLRSKNSRRKQ